MNKPKNIFPFEKEKLDKNRLCIVVTPGFSHPKDSPFILIIQKMLSQSGKIVTFDFRFAKDGKVSEDGKKELEDLKNAVDPFKKKFKRVVMIGKSLGAYMNSVYGSKEHVDLLIHLGYPFHEKNRPDQLYPLDHLSKISCKQYFFAGEKDEYADLKVLERITENLNKELIIVPNSDHSFRDINTNSFEENLSRTLLKIIDILKQL